ncbi:MAG: hypothetical protein JXR76_23390 [Deltaproteobacteria bacterium]|nr:hypothetical protein [Deltaproteobacteria bacterium]
MKSYFKLAGLVFVLITCFSLNGVASWNQTFTPSGVASYFPDPVSGVLIAAAGPDQAGAKHAAQALKSVLQVSDVSGLVMTDEALGDIAALDDAAIVEKCGVFPVELVAVVRVFPSDTGPDNVIVTFYNKESIVIVSFSAIDGVAMALRSSPPVTHEQPPSTPPVADTTDYTPPPAKSIDLTQDKLDALDQYEKRRIFFKEWAGVYIDGHNNVSMPVRWSVPHQGKDEIPLEGADFYTAIERNDLAARYRKRKAIKISLLVLGPSLMLTGGILAGIGFNTETDKCELRSPIDDECMAYENNKVMMNIGVGLVLGGLVVFVPPMFIRPHPVKAGDAHRLARDYNQHLREELGLSEKDIEIREKTSAIDVTNVRFGLFPLQNGAGLSLAGQFNLTL